MPICCSLTPVIIVEGPCRANACAKFYLDRSTNFSTSAISQSSKLREVTLTTGDHLGRASRAAHFNCNRIWTPALVRIIQQHSLLEVLPNALTMPHSEHGYPASNQSMSCSTLIKS